MEAAACPRPCPAKEAEEAAGTVGTVVEAEEARPLPSPAGAAEEEAAGEAVPPQLGQAGAEEAAGEAVPPQLGQAGAEEEAEVAEAAEGAADRQRPCREAAGVGAAEAVPRQPLSQEEAAEGAATTRRPCQAAEAVAEARLPGPSGQAAEVVRDAPLADQDQAPQALRRSRRRSHRPQVAGRR